MNAKLRLMQYTYEPFQPHYGIGFFSEPCQAPGDGSKLFKLIKLVIEITTRLT